MMGLNITRSLWVGLALIVVLSISACGDYSVRLPGGYTLIRVYAGAVLINHPAKTEWIKANIDGYKVLNELVVGHVIIAEHSPEREMSKPGYFILNTKTHEMKQGLDKKAWLGSLQALGITDEPILSKPSRFDKNY